MTERKPVGMSWESFIDRQIREAAERGDFSTLPGFGKPLPDAGQPYNEMWWVQAKLQSEGLSLLPPSLALRKEVEDTRERIPSAPSEAAVRRVVAELNEKIVSVNARTFDGPPSNVFPLNVERELARWSEARAADAAAAELGTASQGTAGHEQAGDGANDVAVTRHLRLTRWLALVRWPAASTRRADR